MTTAHTIMTILEPILVDFIPFALLKLLIESDYYILIFEILIKQERTKRIKKAEIKESQSPPKLPQRRGKKK
ncbi:hypothetical protein HpHA303_01240 [Helicobacter pylori]